MTNNDDNLPEHIKDALKQIPSVTAIEQGLETAKQSKIQQHEPLDVQTAIKELAKTELDLDEMRQYATTIKQASYLKIFNPELANFMLEIENEVKAIADKIMQKRSSYDNF